MTEFDPPLYDQPEPRYSEDQEEQAARDTIDAHSPRILEGIEMIEAAWAAAIADMRTLPALRRFDARDLSDLHMGNMQSALEELRGVIGEPRDA